MRRVGVLTAIFALLVAALRPAPSVAGGLPVVTLDALPQAARAGDTVSIGFFVRVHGVTPIYRVGEADPPFPPVVPEILGRLPATGERVRATARRAGSDGHFAADVVFPAAGAWEWQIDLEPYQPVKLAPLAVAPAVSVMSDPVEPVTTQVVMPHGAPVIGVARGLGALLLATGLALALVSPRRRRAPSFPTALAAGPRR